jgi:hypothetical protein
MDYTTHREIAYCKACFGKQQIDELKQKVVEVVPEPEPEPVPEVIAVVDNEETIMDSAPTTATASPTKG